jgi:Cu(I)-responsive transcriptional regulator
MKPEHAESNRPASLNIGAAAKASGVSAKMIRHYEAIGLLPRAQRSNANYRLYGMPDVHDLRFIRQARSLGFPLGSVRELLALWRNHQRSNAEVKRLATAHVMRLEAKIGESREMAEALRHLADHCHGDGRPECPILEGLAREGDGNEA